MVKRSKLLAMLLILALALTCLAACGDTEAPADVADPGASQQEGQDKPSGSTPEASTDYFYDALDWAKDWMIPDDGVYTGYQYDDGSGNTVGEVYVRFKVYDITEAQMEKYGEKLVANGCDKLSSTIYVLYQDGSINISWSDHSQDGGYYSIQLNPHITKP